MAQKLFGLYDIYTIRAVNRLLRSLGVKLCIKTRPVDDQIEITLEKL